MPYPIRQACWISFGTNPGTSQSHVGSTRTFGNAALSSCQPPFHAIEPRRRARDRLGLGSSFEISRIVIFARIGKILPRFSVTAAQFEDAAKAFRINSAVAEEPAHRI